MWRRRVTNAGPVALDVYSLPASAENHVRDETGKTGQIANRQRYPDRLTIARRQEPAANEHRRGDTNHYLGDLDFSRRQELIGHAAPQTTPL